MSQLRKMIGQRLRTAREAVGFTQKQAGDATGIAREEISYYETGAREISLSKLEALADLYGRTIKYFFDGSPDSQSPATIAFRATGVTEQDMQVIAWAQSLVADADSLERLLKKEHDAK